MFQNKYEKCFSLYVRGGTWHREGYICSIPRMYHGKLSPGVQQIAFPSPYSRQAPNNISDKLSGKEPCLLSSCDFHRQQLLSPPDHGKLVVGDTPMCGWDVLGCTKVCLQPTTAVFGHTPIASVPTHVPPLILILLHSPLYRLVVMIKYILLVISSPRVSYSVLF